MSKQTRVVNLTNAQVLMCDDQISVPASGAKLLSNDERLLLNSCRAEVELLVQNKKIKVNLVDGA